MEGSRYGTVQGGPGTWMDAGSVQYIVAWPNGRMLVLYSKRWPCLMAGYRYCTIQGGPARWQDAGTVQYKVALPDGRMQVLYSTRWPWQMEEGR